LGGRKGIWPVKHLWWAAGMVICLERGADLHMAQLMPLPLTVSCFSKIQIGFTWYQLTWVVVDKGPLNGCVCLCSVFVVHWQRSITAEWLMLQGYHGIEQEVFLSLPVVIGENGINAVFNQKLADDEVEKIKKSAKTLHEIISNISL